MIIEYYDAIMTVLRRQARLLVEADPTALLELLPEGQCGRSGWGLARVEHEPGEGSVTVVLEDSRDGDIERIDYPTEWFDLPEDEVLARLAERRAEQRRARREREAHIKAEERQADVAERDRLLALYPLDAP